VPPELTYFGDASGAVGSRIGDGEQEVDAKNHAATVHGIYKSDEI